MPIYFLFFANTVSKLVNFSKSERRT